MLYALIYLQIKSQCFAHSSEKPEAACPTRKVTRLGLKGTLQSFATDLLLSLGQVISFLCASSFPPILSVFYSACKFLRAGAALLLRAGPVPHTAAPPPASPSWSTPTRCYCNTKNPEPSQFKRVWLPLPGSLSLLCFSIKLFRRGTSHWLSKFPVKGLKQPMLLDKAEKGVRGTRIIRQTRY